MTCKQLITPGDKTQKRRPGKHLLGGRKSLCLEVLGAGIEPAWAFCPRDFKFAAPSALVQRDTHSTPFSPLVLSTRFGLGVNLKYVLSPPG